MKRKPFLIMIGALCLLGAIGLTIYSIIATSRPAVVPGLEYLGNLPLEAYDARQELDEDKNTQFVIFYRYIDSRFGEIVYTNAVDETDYDSYLFDAMRLEELQSEVPEETDETTRKSQIKRYVYAYPYGGQYDFRFYDHYIGLTDVSDEIYREIYKSDPVNSTYYFIFSGILLIAGAYLLFLAFTGKRRKA